MTHTATHLNTRRRRLIRLNTLKSRFKIQWLNILPTKSFAFYDYHNNQRLLSYKPVKGCFLNEDGVCLLCRRKWISINVTQAGHRHRFLSEYFGFPLPVSFHQCSMLIFAVIMLFSEGQSGEAWVTSKQIIYFRKSEEPERKLLSFHVVKNMKKSMKNLWNSRGPPIVQIFFIITQSLSEM